MTKPLIIVRPIPATLTNGGNFDATDLVNIATPNPKEVAFVAGIAVSGGFVLRADFGVAVTLDTVFFGFTNLSGPSYVNAYTCNAAYVDQVQLGISEIVNSTLTPPINHGLVHAPTPRTSRYWNFYLVNNSGGASDIQVGVFAAGLSFKCALGHEYGAGRQVEDTGTAERLIGGGFGIDEGVTVGGYGWTFGDLTDAELSSLYALVRGIGQTKSVLVVEDPDQTAGLAERIHWGLFDRLNAYERLIPGLSRWEFKIRDWG
jgi:hypothetical protein